MNDVTGIGSESFFPTAQDPLRAQFDGTVLWLQLNRPASMNALTTRMVDELTGAIARAGTAPEVRVVVLHGAGRAFCAGTDLKESERLAAAPGANAAYIDALYRLTATIEACPRPVIAAVNGFAVAGGLELALACDLICAARSARLGDGHANYANFPGGGATVRLPRRIGLAKAKYLMLTGRLWSAEQALTAGLVDELADDDRLAETVQGLAEEMARKSPLVLARMKHSLHDGWEQAAEAALQLEREHYDRHSRSQDRAEGLAAFREKRPPRFEGR